MSRRLLGVDVGWSELRRSSAVAWLAGEELGVERVGGRSRLPDRLSELEFDLVAIDAPVTPELFGASARRDCERALSLGRFQRRCKPGMSHVRGTGQQLRAAGARVAARLERELRWGSGVARVPRAGSGTHIVEAFPNAFLGVCVEDEAYEARPTPRRGQKFDWLYERWLARATFERVADAVALPGSIVDRCRTCRDHEERAALVCLMTAAAAFVGRYTAVGNEQGGYFILPALEQWESWARAAIEQSIQRIPSVAFRSESRSG